MHRNMIQKLNYQNNIFKKNFYMWDILELFIGDRMQLCKQKEEFMLNF